MSEQKAITFERDGVAWMLWRFHDEYSESTSRYVTPADLIAAMEQNDALRAEVLKAVLPSAEDLARRAHEMSAPVTYDHRPWASLPLATRRILTHDAAMFLKALGVQA